TPCRYRPTMGWWCWWWSFAEPDRFHEEGLGGLEDLHIVLIHARALDHVDKLRAGIHAGLPHIAIGVRERMARIVPPRGGRIRCDHAIDLDGRDPGLLDHGGEDRADGAIRLVLTARDRS